jgi:hypothetical protein
MPVAETLTAKIVFETVAAVAGFAKEGISLADVLRERKLSETPLLIKYLDFSDDQTREATKNIRKVYETLNDARPKIRRIIRRRIGIRLQVLLGALATMALGLSFTEGLEPGFTLSKSLSMNSWWTAVLIGIFAFFACSMVFRIGELEHPLRFELSSQSQYLPFWSRLAAPWRARIASILKEVWYREHQGLNAADRTLLLEYARINALVDILETQTLAASCAESSITIGACLFKEIDEAVLKILLDATEYLRVNPDLRVCPLSEHLLEIYQQAGIGFIVDTKRYKSALHSSAVEIESGNFDVRRIFEANVSRQQTLMLSSNLIESGRLSAGERVMSLVRKIGRGIKAKAPVDDGEAE